MVDDPPQYRPRLVRRSLRPLVCPPRSLHRRNVYLASVLRTSRFAGDAVTIPKPRTATDPPPLVGARPGPRRLLHGHPRPGDRGRRAAVDGPVGTERLTITYLPVFAITIGS